MFLVQVPRGVELLAEELVDDGGHELGRVEVDVVAALNLAVDEVRVVLPQVEFTNFDIGIIVSIMDFLETLIMCRYLNMVSGPNWVTCPQNTFSDW